MSAAKKSLTEGLLIALLCAVALVATGPTVAGYARALAGLPIYGAACGLNKIFGSTAATPDEYRSFVLGRGCSIDAAIREIATVSGSNVDPGRIISIYHGTLRAESGDELSTMSAVHSALRNFATADAANSACTTAEDCAASALPPGYDLAGMFSAYRTFAQAHFLDAVDDGADYIAGMLRMGPLGQAIVLVVYTVVVLVLTKTVLDLVFLGLSLLSKNRPRKR